MSEHLGMEISNWLIGPMHGVFAIKAETGYAIAARSPHFFIPK